MTDEQIPIITAPPPNGSYEARSWFTRYQSVFAAMGAVVAVLAFITPPMLGFRDQVRDNRGTIDRLSADFIKYQSEQSALAIREESDARRLNDQVMSLIAKVDLLTTLNQKGH